MIPISIEIIYQDDYLVAINKPAGLLTHRSRIASREDLFALQLVRDQVKKRVYPVHRLDRKTSGILVFALSSDMARNLQSVFSDTETIKKYQAIVRGYFPDSVLVDHPLTNDRNKTQDAITDFYCIKKTEIDLPFGKFQTSRYSLIEAFPKTGRMHQIRKHLNHLRHPIIGDRPHGCNKQNRLFKEKWNMITMLLHAAELSFQHPETKAKISIKAPVNSEFTRMKNGLNLA